MEFGKETEELYHKFEVDLSEEEAKSLSEFGLKLISNDTEELINYAVNYILREKIKEKENAN